MGFDTGLFPRNGEHLQNDNMSSLSSGFTWPSQQDSITTPDSSPNSA